VGNDTYIVDNAGDVVIENPGEGTDAIQASVSYTLPDNVENLSLTGAVAINGTGNALDNIISGNSSNNILSGLGGADVLDGGGGTDTASYAASLSGVNVSLATGAAHGGDAEGDTLISIENLTGSAFNDTLEGDSGNNVLNGGAGIDTVSYEHAAAGVTVNLTLITAQNTIGAGTDSLAGIENLTGSAYDDVLTGNSSANVLAGGTGNDRLTGGSGDDVFVFQAGFGHDVVTDFSVGDTTHHDTLDLRGLGFTSTTDVLNHTDLGASAVIHAGSADITLTGVTKALLSSHTFDFLV